ncbi:hypothetical protein ACHQM5_020750 [Ranunculus cassubicifolius]
MENTHTKISSSQWTRKNCIGRGSFGKVHIAVNKTDNRIFAVKSVNSYTAPPSHLEALENEIQILQSLSSPYIIEYLGNDSTHESSTESYRNLHMEYMYGGSVADGGRIKDEQMVRSYTRHIVSALRYIHSRGIVHSDVKGKNVLLGSKPGVAKLADFGSAKRISKEEGMIKAQGTPLWMAPEVIRQEKQGPESDVWSLGCTIIEMITGKSAWKDSESTVVFRIGFSDELPEFPYRLSELGKDFLSKCLRREPSERWSCEQLLRHPFVSETDICIESSPRSILDWANSEFHEDDDEEDQEPVQISNDESVIISAKDRISELASSRGAIWESDGWDVVRSDTLGNRGGEAGCSAGEEEVGTTHSEYSNVGGDQERIWMEYLDLMSFKLESEDRKLCSGGGWPMICGGLCCGCKAGLSCQPGVIKSISVVLKKKEGNSIFCKLFLLFTLLIHLIKSRIDLLYYFRLHNSYASFNKAPQFAKKKTKCPKLYTKTITNDDQI